MRRRSLVVGLPALLLVRCGGDGGPPAARPTVTPGVTGTTAQSGSPTREPRSPTPELAPDPTATEAADRTSPLGFPIDPATVLGLVEGVVGSRVITWGAGARALDYSRDDQPSDDPVRANRCGWNARTHVQYEGQPAVDWYVPTGTPIASTLDGTATLLMNTVSNPFDVYGVSREPYIGDPDESRAPFPGPGGGQGVFVRVTNESYSVDFGHMEVGTTVASIDTGAFVNGYGPGDDYQALFAELRDFRTSTAIARWAVRRGDVIGFSGDSGYSEAPHLHYAIRYAGAGSLLCPTTEAGFTNGGWLFR